MELSLSCFGTRRNHHVGLAKEPLDLTELRQREMITRHDKKLLKGREMGESEWSVENMEEERDTHTQSQRKRKRYTEFFMALE